MEWNAIAPSQAAEIDARHGEVATVSLPYAPLVQSLATLPAPLAQAIAAIHYVRVERGILGKTDAAGDWHFAEKLLLVP